VTIYSILLAPTLVVCVRFISQERSNDYMEEENYPNELEVIVVRGVKLRVMDTKSMLNRNPSSVNERKE
jgi:hypothetical protein